MKDESLHKETTLECIIDVFIAESELPSNGILFISESQFWTDSSSYVILRWYPNEQEVKYNGKKEVGVYRGYSIYRSFSSLNNKKVNSNFAISSEIEFINAVQIDYGDKKSCKNSNLPPTQTFVEIHFEYDFFKKKIIHVFDKIGVGAKLEGMLLNSCSPTSTAFIK